MSPLSRNITVVNGIDLKVERIRAGVLQQDLALALGVSRTTVVAWERAHFISTDRADRYLHALSGLSRTSRPSAATA